MAETVTQITQPPEFIEAAAKPFITQLQQVTGDLKEADLTKIYGPQFTAGLGALTQQAIGQAGGLGAYKPFLQQAGTQAAQRQGFQAHRREGHRLHGLGRGPRPRVAAALG